MEKIREIEAPAFYSYVEKFSSTFTALKQDYCIYLVGHTFLKIKDVQNIDLENIAKLISCKKENVGWLSLLPIPKPVFFGFQLEKVNNLLKVFHRLDDHIMLEILMVGRACQDEFLEELRQADKPVVWKSLAKCKNYFSYAVDFDSMEVSSGIIEVRKFGDLLSKDVRRYLEDII